MPCAGSYVAVVGHDAPRRRECQRQSVRRDFANSVVGRVGEPYALALACRGIDGIVASADPAHDPDVGQRRQDARRDRRKLQENAAASCSRRDHLVFCFALSDDDVDPRTGEKRAFELDVGVVVVGVEDSRQG